MLYDRTIWRGVIKVLKQKVAEAQKAYEEECKMHDEVCENTKKLADATRDHNKANAAQNHIMSIIGKIL